MSTKAKSTPVSSKASKTLKGQSKGKKINPKPLCNLCGSPFEDEEETLHCEGDCGQIYHRYCAGISKAYYTQLCDKATPFVCLVCSQQMNIIVVQTLQKEIASLKKEIADLKDAVDAVGKNLSLPGPIDCKCKCKEAIDSIQGEMGQLHSVVENQHSLYADIVKKSGKNQQNPGKTPSKTPKTPKVVVVGSRKIWGTRRSTTTSEICDSIKSISDVDVNAFSVKRKYKTIKSSQISKWWFVVRGDESKLKILEDNWLLIDQQARWKLEPLYRFSDPLDKALGTQAQDDNENPSLDPPEDQVQDVTDQGSQAQSSNVDQSLEPTEDENNSQPPFLGQT